MRYARSIIVCSSSRFAKVVFAIVLITSLPAFAQSSPPDHSIHHPATAPTDMSLPDQISDLRAKVSKLEAALQQKQMPMAGMSQGGPGAMSGMGQSSGGGGMGMMMDGMMGMGGSNQPMGQMQGMPSGNKMSAMSGSEMGAMGSMASMPGGGMQGMEGMEGMMSMMGMSPGGSMGGMAMPTALPGFPGASHLYHIGSTGFFLDHGNHITLTTEQQTALNSAKEKALLDKADTQRKIEAAEQELWTLTASDQPDATKIETKVREVEKLRGDDRLNFIRAVGEAAKVLTDEQRKSLLGQLPPQHQSSAPAGGMGHM